MCLVTVTVLLGDDLVSSDLAIRFTIGVFRGTYGVAVFPKKFIAA